MNIFTDTVILGHTIKPLTLICSVFLLLFVYRRLVERWWVKILLSGAIVFAANMQFEIFWNAAYLLSVWNIPWLVYDMVLFSLIEALLIKTLTKIYKIELDFRIFWAVSIFLCVSMIVMWRIGFFHVCDLWMSGLSNYDPHDKMPYILIWIPKVVCLLSWCFIPQPKKNLGSSTPKKRRAISRFRVRQA